MSQEVILDHTNYSVALDCRNCDAHQSEPSIQCDNCGAVLVRGLRPGTVIAGQYEYIDTIGAGGMGLIIRARDKTSSEVLAVKLLLYNNNPTETRRFQLEAKAASMLSHDHIIRIYDFGTSEDGYPYMAMEYLEGVNLSTLIATKGSLDLGEVLYIFDQISAAMSYAHAKGIVHRDIKPSNIMLTGRNRDHVKIVDFGIAKLLDPDSAEKNLTKTGHIVGSPLYMSPEQASGKKIDVRTDIYSAGCVLFHALTGAPPIEGSTAIETLLRHLNTIPPTLSEASLGTRFPQNVEDIVAKMLSKEPANRYQSFQELRADLHQASCNRFLSSREAPRAVLSNKAIFIVLPLISIAVIGVTMAYFWNLQHQVMRKGKAIAAASITNSLAANKDAKGAQVTGGSDAQKVNEAKVISASTKPKPKEEKEEKENPDPTMSALIQQFSGDPHDCIDAQVSSGKGEFTLNSTKPKMNDANVEYLVASLSKSTSPIKSLCLSGTNIDDDAVLDLSKLKTVRRLDLGNTHVDGNAMKDLVKMSSLEELHLNGLNVRGPDLVVLAKLKTLKRLDLMNCKNLRGDEYAFLSKLDLDLLYLNNDFNIGPTGLKYIATQHNLSTLSLAFARNIPGTALNYLKDLPSLHTLDLSGLTLSAKEFSALSQLPDLVNLNLSSCSLTPDGFESLKTMTRLNVLRICNLRVSAKPFDSSKPIDAAEPLTPKQETELTDALTHTSVSTARVEDNVSWANEAASEDDPKLQHDPRYPNI
jgi:serine/threonine protein kinase